MVKKSYAKHNIMQKIKFYSSNFYKIICIQKYKDTSMEQSFLCTHTYLNTKQISAKFQPLQFNGRGKPLDRGGSLSKEFEPPRSYTCRLLGKSLNTVYRGELWRQENLVNLLQNSYWRNKIWRIFPSSHQKLFSKTPA